MPSRTDRTSRGPHANALSEFLKENGLSIVMFSLFLIFLVGQSISGLYAYNEDQIQHGQAAVSWAEFVTSSRFVEATFENWESEFLQMGLYVILTAILYQRGSAESKSLDKPEAVDEEPEKSRRRKGVPSPVWRGGLLLSLYKRSLGLALLLLFAMSFLLHAAGGAADFREEHAQHGQVVAMTMWQYMGTSRFWFESFQNWQSEFLAIGAIIVLSIFLRQKGSPESKPVAARHDEEAE